MRKTIVTLLIIAAIVGYATNSFAYLTNYSDSYGGVVGIQVSGNKLHKGDRIGYITPEGYLEEEVLSLQVDKQDIEEAVPGQIVGIKTVYPKNLIRKGTVVCNVERKT